MKKLFFTLVLVIGVAAISKAQDVGQMWIGGTAGIWYESVKDGPDYTSYKLIPEFGYVFSEDLGVGLNVGFAHAEGSQATMIGDNAIIAGDADGVIVNPFIRYTFAKGSVGALFLDGGVGYTYLKDKVDDLKTDMIEVGFRPGAAIKVSDKVSILGKFGFFGYQYAKVGNIKANAVGLDLDMRQFQIGVSVVF